MDELDEDQTVIPEAYQAFYKSQISENERQGGIENEDVSKSDEKDDNEEDQAELGSAAQLDSGK